MLRCVYLFIIELEKYNVYYCHWKSNEHLEAAVKGETDLDILFDISNYKIITEILSNNGFKKFKTPWYRAYKGIEDYIAIDPDKGKIVHVHAHFLLTIGKSGNKNYHLTWESEIFRSRIKNDLFNIFTINPTLELLLLYIRLALKTEGIFNKKRLPPSELDQYTREERWLRERISKEQIHTVSIKLLGKKNGELILSIFEKGISQPLIHRLWKGTRQIKGLETHNSLIRAKVNHIVKRSISFTNKVLYKFGFIALPKKRVFNGNGAIIALMGSDGSGKSTQLNSIAKEFRKKTDVVEIYMGSGNGKSNLIRKPFESIKKFLDSRKGKKEKSLLHHFVTILWKLSLAIEKFQKLKKAQNLRRQGFLVLCDRYPQLTIKGHNDGPLLYDFYNSKNLFLKAISRFEYYCYKKSIQHPPDFVFKLIGTIEVLNARRPEMQKETIVKKQEGIKSIPFPAATRVIEINADKEVTLVTKEILSHFWYSK